ncbi:DUF4262 domain-containing protein [Micromonospora chersina]|uniref:DUF4262 domain-containing protein n=1 Tax=Micromonospora chersina TaxID=47854 RepID=UPI00371EDEC7
MQGQVSWQYVQVVYGSPSGHSVLLRSLPNPLTAAEITNIRDARPAGPSPTPAPNPMLVERPIGHYGRDRLRLQQVVWPDRHGRFPWDAAYAFPSAVQPLIARP